MKPLCNQGFKDRNLKSIDAYCLSLLDRSKTFVSVGNRNYSVKPMELVAGQKIFGVLNHEKCFRAELANGLKTAAINGVALKLLKGKDETVKSQGQAGAWLKTTMGRICLQNCDAIVGRKSYFVLSHDKGVFLVDLKGVREDETEVGHVIVVDAIKKIIWDCVQEYGLNLDSYVFNHCIGEGERFCAVTKLKRLDI